MFRRDKSLEGPADRFDRSGHAGGNRQQDLVAAGPGGQCTGQGQGVASDAAPPAFPLRGL